MKAFCWLTVSMAALISAGTAHAQTGGTTDPAAASSAEPADTGEDIVVTAERRTTSLQRTGVAATVLTGEDLVRKNVNSVEQLQFATPSLTVNTAGQGNAFNIRGIGKVDQTSSIGVGVVTYRDGVATLPGYFQLEPYYDLGSVEVLRGPQGTFAGGNATGGAVFITAANPSLDRVKGYGMAQLGNYDNFKVQGAVNIPLSDTLAIRLAGNIELRDTFYDLRGPWTGNPGDRRDYSGRVSLLWQPAPELRVLIKGDYNNIEFGGIPASRIGSTTDPLYAESDSFLAGRDEFGRIVANIAYTFDSGLTLRSISGFQRGTTQGSVDLDGSARPATAATPAVNYRGFATEEIWSQEFNIVSPDDGPFTWVLGGYWQHDKTTFVPGKGYVVTRTPNSFPSPLVYNESLAGTQVKTSLAGFGQVGYEFADGLQLTVGARWSRDTTANDAYAAATVFGIELLRLTQKDFTAAKKLNGKVALNWTVNPNHFLYAFVATGSKAGGLNGPNVAGITPRAFKAEQVTDYEIGWKGTFLDGRLRTQLGGYYNVYEDLQTQIVDPSVAAISSIYNVPGKTKLYGIEFSAQANLDAFTFDLAGSVSNSKLGTFFASDPRFGAAAAVCNPATGPAVPGGRCLDLTGNENPYAPKFTLSVGAQYTMALGENSTLTPRIDYAHIGEVWGTVFQNAARGDRLTARDIVNAQLTLALGSFSLTAFSTNLLNQHYITAINGERRLAGAPRQYGIRANIAF